MENDEKASLLRGLVVLLLVNRSNRLSESFGNSIFQPCVMQNYGYQ
jgi:hypothetical protein